MLTAALLAGAPLTRAGAEPAAAATQLTATPTSLDFGDVQLGTASAPQQVQVTNAGTAAVTLSGTYGSSGPFASSGNCKGATLPKGGTCHLTMTFTPTATGASSATVVDTFNGVKLDTAVVGTGYSRLEITPTAFDFGDVAVNETSAQQKVIVTNITSQPMLMSGSYPAIGAFSAISNCSGSTLAPGGSCFVAYEFSPTALGAANAVATGTWNGQSYKVALRGTGVPELMISPTSLDFGTVRPGTQSASQVVKVTNRGAAPAQMTWDITVPPPFIGSVGCSNTTLAVGASCAITFVFKPTADGTAGTTAYVTFDGVQYTIALAGAGGLKTPPSRPLLITPTALNFGIGALDTPGPGQPVTVTNRGGASVVLKGTQNLAPGFRVRQSCQNKTLAPGASCTMTYQLSTPTLGTNATTGTGSWNGQSFSIGLSGTGVPDFLITPLGLEFGPSHAGSHGPQRVTVTNEGGSVKMDGDGGGTLDFSGITNCPEMTLATGASCHSDYYFEPQSLGRITETATGNWLSQSYSIAFGGLALGNYLITPTGLAFGKHAVGTKSAAQTVTVTNVSGSALNMSITGTTVPANFTATTTCGTSLAAGASCTYSIAFAPTSAGAKQGTLHASFVTQDELGQQALQVALAGTGT